MKARHQDEEEIHTMLELFARDLHLGMVAQDVQTITGLDESRCRRAVYTATDPFRAPTAFLEATEQLVAGLREGDTTRPIVVAFGDAVERVSHEQGDGEPTQPLSHREPDYLF